MKKAYFQYYETFENIILKINDVEEREFLRAAVIQYGLFGLEPAGLNELEDMAFTIIKEMIDQQQHRRQVNAANRTGKKANPAPAAKPAQDPDEPKEKKEKFIKPTIEEIEAEIKEKNYKVDATAFFTYYEGNGWRVGRNPIKNWKMTLANWNTREKKNGGTIYNAVGSPDELTKEYEDLF